MGSPRPFLNLSRPIVPLTSIPRASALPPNVPFFKYFKPLASVWNGIAPFDSVRFLTEPTALTVLMAVA